MAKHRRRWMEAGYGESKPRLMLSTGTIVKHLPKGSGVTEAVVHAGGEMTPEEWREYSKHVSGPRRPLPKKTGYIVRYGGSGRLADEPHMKASRRVYTADAAERIVRRLQRQGIDAYKTSMTTRGKLHTIRGKKTSHRRSR